MIWLIRHGETEWTVSGAHTGRSDIPLTPNGEAQALGIPERLGAKQFSLVLTSPLQRARRTCELAGYGEHAQLEPNLAEWFYGDYEGRTSSEIRAGRPGWSIFKDGPQGGETLAQVAERTQKVIERCLAVDGDVALFSHGHTLRILAASWLGLPPETAKHFALGTAGISILGLENETRNITLWNR